MECPYTRLYNNHWYHPTCQSRNCDWRHSVQRHSGEIDAFGVAAVKVFDPFVHFSSLSLDVVDI